MFSLWEAIEHCALTHSLSLSLSPSLSLSFPLMCCREGHLTVAQLLLNHNARVNVPSGSENNIPLTLACWKG